MKFGRDGRRRASVQERPRRGGSRSVLSLPAIISLIIGIVIGLIHSSSALSFPGEAISTLDYDRYGGGASSSTAGMIRDALRWFMFEVTSGATNSSAFFGPVTRPWIDPALPPIDSAVFPTLHPGSIPGITSWHYLKTVATECRGTNCASFPMTIAEPPQMDVFKGGNSPFAAVLGPAAPGQINMGFLPIATGMEITYESSPPSAGDAVLDLLCRNRLPETPSSILVACDASGVGTAGMRGLSFHSSTMEAALDFDSKDWQVSADVGSGLRVGAASSLSTPLDDFGFDQTIGIDVRTRGGLEVIGTLSSLQLLQRISMPIGEFFAGITSQGPVSGFEFASGPVAGYVTALFSNNQVGTAGALTVRAGDFRVGYEWDPADTRFGLSYVSHDGPTMKASWSAEKGMRFWIEGTFSLGPGAAESGPEVSTNPASPSLPTGEATLALPPGSPGIGPSLPFMDIR